MRPPERHEADWQAGRPGRRAWLWAWAIFGVAALVRLAYLLEVVEGPIFKRNRVAGTDMQGFDLWARQIAGGDWIGRGAFYQAPAWPYWLGLLYAVFGSHAVVGVAGNHLLGALTCVVVLRLGWDLFDERVGVVTGALAALYAPLVFYEGYLLSTALEVLLAVAFALALTRAAGGDPPSGPPWFIAGVAGGLATAARPNFLVTLPGTLLLLGLRRRRPARRRALGLAAAYVAGLAVILGPITLRNVVVGGQLIPIASSGPITFRIGNSFDSTPIGFVYPKLPPMPLTSLAFWRHQAVKFLYFWYGREVPQNANYYFGLAFSWVLTLIPVEFWMLAPLGVVGMVVAAGEWRRGLPIHLLFWPYVLSIVAFFIVARFRLPAVALLFPFAAAALVWIWDGIKARQRRPVEVALLVLAVALALRPWAMRFVK